MKKLLLLNLIFISTGLFAQTIHLDSAFNGIGYASYYYQNHYDGAYDMDIQSDGKILLVGDATYWTATLLGKIERLNPDGTNDTSFHSSNFPDTSYSSCLAVKVQPDGKILVGGSTSATNLLVRYDSSGDMDTTFNHTGFTILNVTPERIFILSNGKILVSGTGSGVVRLMEDGTIDSSYGVNGYSIINRLYAFSSVLQPDEKLLITGSAVNNSFGFDSAEVVRLDTIGNLDMTFGNVGRVFPSTSNDPFMGSFSIIQNDGKIITAVRANAPVTSTPMGILSRVDASGIEDTTYHFADSLNNVYFSEGMILPNNHTLFVVSSSDVRFLQLNEDASYDAALLNNDSIVATGGDIYRLLQQADGKLLTTGRIFYNNSAGFGAFRFDYSIINSTNPPIRAQQNNFEIFSEGEYLNLMTNDAIMQLTIYDLNGKIIQISKSSDIEYSSGKCRVLKSPSLMQGVYLIQVITKSGEILTKKF